MRGGNRLAVIAAMLLRGGGKLSVGGHDIGKAFEIGPGFRGNAGTGWAPVYSRPGRNGRGANATKRAARKAAGRRKHRQRRGMRA